MHDKELQQEVSLYLDMQRILWQEGYGAFSVSPSNKNALIQYIENQDQHHRKYDFREEFLLLLQKHGVQHDEKYLWK